MRSIKILFNPSSGSGRSNRKENFIKKVLNNYRLDHDFIITQSEHHMVDEAKESAMKDQDIVCIGGDTSFSLVAEKILEIRRSSSRLGMVGTGSANDIPVGLGCGDISDLFSCVKENKTKKMDVGSFRINGGKEKIFLGTLSAGLGVSVNRYLEEFKKNNPRVAKATPFLEFIRGAFGVKHSFDSGEIPKNIKVRSEQFRGALKFSLLLFLNTPLYAKGIKLSPDASSFDGLLDCCIVNTVSLKDTFNLLHKIKNRSNDPEKRLKIIKGTSFNIEFDRSSSIQFDGEIIDGIQNLDVSTGKMQLEIFCS